MNRKRIILVSLILFLVIGLFGQRVEFQYDDNGNRISRTIIVEQFKSTVKFPIMDPKQLVTIQNSKAKSLEAGGLTKNEEVKSQEDSIRERVKTEEGEISTNVYPNPNRGLIKIDILNMPVNSINEVRLYDLNGNEIKSLKNIESYSEIDISQYMDGIYILRIKIKERIFDWKIVKTQNQ